jgi:hypothetical protein
METTGPTGRANGSGPGQADGDGAKSPKDMATAAAGAVKQEVATFASSVQDKAQDRIEDKKQVATKTMGDFASAIRRAGDELAQNDQSTLGRVVKQAADGLEQLTRTVSEKRPEELLDAARQFGRSNPTAFIAGSVLLGVALGRFARSSETHAADAERATDREAAYEPAPDGGATFATGADVDLEASDAMVSPGLGGAPDMEA